MKKAIIILAVMTQTAYAGSNGSHEKIHVAPIMINGQVVYVQVESPVVTKSAQAGYLKVASKKPSKPDYRKGLRRSLLRSNFR